MIEFDNPAQKQSVTNVLVCKVCYFWANTSHGKQ